MLPGAVWRDPARVGEWAGELPADREVIVYCVFGHEVSRNAVLQLRAAGPGLRHWLVNGLPPSDAKPFPASLTFASFEWAVHFAVTTAMAPSILFHAAVACDDIGRAVALVGESGSGKSTLLAGLVTGGWRLVADEFLIFSPTGAVQPMPGPITLKKESIELIRTRAPSARVTAPVDHPLRGVISHLLAPRQVASGEEVRVAAVVFPTFVEGRATSFARIDQPAAFQKLVVQSHNRHVLGPAGFRLLCEAARIPAWSLRYSDFADGLAAVGSALEATG